MLDAALKEGRKSSGNLVALSNKQSSYLRDRETRFPTY